MIGQVGGVKAKCEITDGPQTRSAWPLLLAAGLMWKPHMAD